MTRLPMARRVSTVALPICGVRTTLSMLRKRLRHVRLIREHVKPGSAETAVPKRRDKSRLIDHGSARHIDQHPFRTKRLDHLAADKLARVGAPWRHHEQHLAGRCHFGEIGKMAIRNIARIAVVVADLRVERLQLLASARPIRPRPRMPTRRLSAERESAMWPSRDQPPARTWASLARRLR